MLGAYPAAAVCLRAQAIFPTFQRRPPVPDCRVLALRLVLPESGLGPPIRIVQGVGLPANFAVCGGCSDKPAPKRADGVAFPRCL